MKKKYIVRLVDEEREQLAGVVRKLAGGSERVKRAQILLKADADGPNWTDGRIAEAFGCRTRTIEKLRERLVTQGFEAAVERKQRAEPLCPKMSWPLQEHLWNGRSGVGAPLTLPGDRSSIFGIGCGRTKTCRQTRQSRTAWTRWAMT